MMWWYSLIWRTDRLSKRPHLCVCNGYVWYCAPYLFMDRLRWPTRNLTISRPANNPAIRTMTHSVNPGTGVGVGAGGGGSAPNSNPPMSLATPCGRANPRWSVAGAMLSSPLSMAGLPASRAWVKVGPPLSSKGPRSGSCPVTLPVRSPTSVHPLVS